jgi:hypothetical protein
MKLSEKEEELKNLEKNLKIKEAGLKARGMEVSVQMKKSQAQQEQLKKQLQKVQTRLKEQDEKVKELNDALIVKGRENYDLGTELRKLKLEIAKFKFGTKEKERLVEQKDLEIVELQKSSEDAVLNKEAVAKLQADLEKSKKEYDNLKTSYDQLKEKHEQQTQSDLSKSVSLKLYEELRDEKLEIEKKYRKLNVAYEKICSRFDETVKKLDKALEDKKIFREDRDMWRDQGEERFGELLKEKRKVTELLNTQQDVYREKAAKELTMIRNNRRNNYDNDCFGEASNWSESNIPSVNFDDFKASVVKKFKESMKVEPKDEKKLLNTFVNTLDEVWGSFSGNNVVRNLNGEGAFNDSCEKGSKSFFDNRESEDNLYVTPKRKGKNTGCKTKKSKVGVETGNGKYK